MRTVKFYHTLLPFVRETNLSTAYDIHGTYFRGMNVHISPTYEVTSINIRPGGWYTYFKNCTTCFWHTSIYKYGFHTTIIGPTLENMYHNITKLFHILFSFLFFHCGNRSCATTQPNAKICFTLLPYMCQKQVCLPHYTYMPHIPFAGTDGGCMDIHMLNMK